MGFRLDVTDREAELLQARRRREQDAKDRAFQVELLRRCPDYPDYSAVIGKLKLLFPRGAADPRQIPGHSPIEGTHLLDYLEGLYLIAKHASFGKHSNDPMFGSGRPRPGVPVPEAATAA
jgi:hypothetical protein